MRPFLPETPIEPSGRISSIVQVGSVAEDLAAVGHQSAVVLAGGDLVADVQRVRAGGEPGAVVEFAAADPVALAALVQPFDDLVGRCHERDRHAFGAARRPPGNGGALHLVDRAAAEPAVGVVVGDDRGVAAAQPEAGAALPLVFEAVVALELDRAERVDEKPERAAHATLGLAAGVSPKVMSGRLGHATVAFTQDVYVHAMPEREQEAADIVAALFTGTEGQT